MRIIRRARLRKELKPVQIFGPDDNFAATWLLIVHEQGRQDFEAFTLVFLRPDGAASTWMGFSDRFATESMAAAIPNSEFHFAAEGKGAPPLTPGEFDGKEMTPLYE